MNVTIRLLIKKSNDLKFFKHIQIVHTFSLKFLEALHLDVALSVSLCQIVIYYVTYFPVYVDDKMALSPTLKRNVRVR